MTDEKLLQEKYRHIAIVINNLAILLENVYAKQHLQ